MGYRSDIEIVCRESAYKELSEMEEINFFRPGALFEPKTKLYRIIIEWVKWYPEYEEVQKIERKLDELSLKAETNPEFEFVFARMGEDDSDYEERNCCNYNFVSDYVRQFQLPDGLEEIK